MPQLGDENEKVTNSVIPNGTEAKVMRNLIENKGLLNGKGKLYAGTDDTTSTGAPVTTAIDPKNASECSVLIKDSSQAGGWKVDRIGKDNIKDAAITPEKLDSTKEYSVKNITASGNVIIQFERDNVTWGGGGMQYTKNGTYGGEMQVPDRSMSVSETFATEEEIKRQIESGKIVAKTAQAAKIAEAAKTAKTLQGWYRHFVTVSLSKGSGVSAATFQVFFELFTHSAGQITDMSKLIAAIQTFGYTALATGAGYVGTGAKIPDAYHINDNILENRVYNVLRVVYDDHMSTKACCMMIAKTTVSNISSEDYSLNTVAMDKFSDVYIDDAVSSLFS